MELGSLGEEGGLTQLPERLYKILFELRTLGKRDRRVDNPARMAPTPRGKLKRMC